MGIKLTNNANATLAAGIDSSATSITLTSGQGARFPTLAGGDYFYATLVDTSNNLEIVKCTARSTDVLTVVRAQESTTARAYVTGDRIEIRLTAQTFIDAVNEIGPTQVSDEANSSTGYFALPSGTTAQRPGSPVEAMFRHNTDTDNIEFYDSGVWKSPNLTYAIDFLVVAGGGAGGAGSGLSHFGNGGGGAGGAVDSAANVFGGLPYTVTVGAGAATNPYTSPYVRGGSGSNSVFGSFATAIGGGGGGSHDATAPSGGLGGSGGSGGGGTSVGAGGSGTAGQGNNGGNGTNSNSSAPGSGGGGAGAAGSNAAGNGGTGVGGNGINWKSLGTFYAGGGGGGNISSATSAAGGSGGGGAGGSSATNNGGAGTVNTGGGGGGGYNAPGTGGAGGSGVVIIRYVGDQRGTGGTVTSSGGYTYHTFTSSGTFTA